MAGELLQDNSPHRERSTNMPSQPEIPNAAPGAAGPRAAPRRGSAHLVAALCFDGGALLCDDAFVNAVKT